MKKNLLLLFSILAVVNIAYAQAPNAIPYQGVARNAAGNILAAQPISLRVSIHDISASGTVVFSETHAVTTTALGLFNVNIGSGTAVTGTLAAVNWGSGAKYIQVEMDATGGTSYADMGTTKLNSVPYALYASKIAADTTPVVAGVNNTPSDPIPDASCTGITSSIAVTGQPVSVNSANIMVKLDITHTYDADLHIYLIAPDGSILCLASANGGGAHNFTNTIFSDASSTNISSGVAPFTGTFKPNGSLNPVCSTTATAGTFAAIGAGMVNPNGTWSLKIFDQAGSDVGTLNNWSISIANPVTGGLANYVPKWNSASSFVQSSIYDNGNVGIGTTTPSASAKLDISSTTQGFLPPRMNNTQRNAIVSPATGLTIYNTTTKSLEVFTGTSWASTAHYIGETYGGGIVFYVYDNGQHGLIAATADQSTGIRWYNGSYTVTNAVRDGIGAGIFNTERIIANQGPGAYAAQICANYQVGNYGDWYLPSKYELNLLYLQKNVVGGFADNYYWSSTEQANFFVWYQAFNGGYQDFWSKVETYYVRAVRAF